MFDIICLDSTATFLGIFDPSIAPTFLYYAYIPIAIISLLLGFFIFHQKNKFHLPNKLFFTLTIIYSLHILNEIVQWVAVPASIIHFSWSLVVLFYLLITVVIVMFNIAYISKKSFEPIHLILGIIVSLPVLILLPTSTNRAAIDLANCHADTGPVETYVFILMYASLAFFLYQLVKYYKNREYRLISLGCFFTIFILLIADNISEYLYIFEFNLFGPVGMLIMLCTIGYLLSEFTAFGSKVATTKILVSALIFIIISEIFIVENTTMLILVGITGLFSSIGGYLLVKSIDREIKQREQIEQLAMGLERANERLQVLDKQKSEFVSIASHQLRSPLTAIRGYVSMMTEGSFGKLPDKANEALGRIQESTIFMASSIDDFLEVSRIESGNMKYDYKDMNFKEQAEHIVDDLRADAVRRGLLLMFRSDMSGTGMVHADAGKTQQILHNLINNALKYTPKGSVTVYAHDDVKNKKMYVDIIDTGLGLSPESLQKLFGKFARAKVASSANIMGTGLGLFVAREMARAMGGDITVMSDGEGLGSTFTIVLPLI